MAKPEHFDIAIIGGGIAGISFAAAVSSQAKVLLLEAEENFSEHATGRSAAYFAPSYGTRSFVTSQQRASRLTSMAPRILSVSKSSNPELLCLWVEKTNKPV